MILVIIELEVKRYDSEEGEGRGRRASTCKDDGAMPWSLFSGFRLGHLAVRCAMRESFAKKKKKSMHNTYP